MLRFVLLPSLNQVIWGKSSLHHLHLRWSPCLIRSKGSHWEGFLQRSSVNIFLQLHSWSMRGCYWSSSSRPRHSLYRVIRYWVWIISESYFLDRRLYSGLRELFKPLNMPRRSCRLWRLFAKKNHLKILFWRCLRIHFVVRSNREVYHRGFVVRRGWD